KARWRFHFACSPSEAPLTAQGQVDSVLDEDVEYCLALRDTNIASNAKNRDFSLIHKIDVPAIYTIAMFDFPLVIVDIETTGASNHHSRIIEVAALRVENGEVVDTFSSLVNPGVRIPHFITALTSITDQTISSAPYFPEIAPALAEFLRGAAFMAHN